MNYYLLECDRSLEDAVVVACVPENGPKSYVYKKLKPMAKNFPNSAKIYYSNNYPMGIVLYDCIDNTDGIFILSEKIKKIIDQIGQKCNEFLKVEVLDHRKKLVPDANYFILNYFDSLEFIDLKHSNVKMDTMSKDEIFEIKGDIYLNHDAIPDDTHIFRAKNWPDKYFVSELFVNKMEESNVTGYILKKTLAHL